MGGSELLAQELRQRLPDPLREDFNIILNSSNAHHLSKIKRNILWNHLSYDQEAMRNISNPEFLKNIEKIVFVSHWQYEKYRYFHNIPTEKSVVIRNAIPVSKERSRAPIDPKRRLRLIYTSTPWRGLSVLLEAFQILDRSDVELHVYSSTKIYGVEFHQANEGLFKSLFDRARAMPSVILHDYVSNRTIRDVLYETDVFVYPSIFEETSCLSAIEAAMAGCALVTTNYGALYETLGDWANFVEFETDTKLLARKFAKVLNKVIEKYREPNSIDHRKKQKLHFERNWSWDARVAEWEEFFAGLK